MKTAIVFVPVATLACTSVASEPVQAERTVPVQLVSASIQPSSKEVLEARRDRAVEQAQERGRLMNAFRAETRGTPDVRTLVSAQPVKVARPNLDSTPVPTLPGLQSAAGDDACAALTGADSAGRRRCAPRL